MSIQLDSVTTANSPASTSKRGDQELPRRGARCDGGRLGELGNGGIQPVSDDVAAASGDVFEHPHCALFEFGIGAAHP